jgi:hypothetical protein
MVFRLRALARVIRWEEPWALEDDDELDGTPPEPVAA